jgi:polyhydroxybutyrate depolymerase
MPFFSDAAQALAVAASLFVVQSCNPSFVSHCTSQQLSQPGTVTDCEMNNWVDRPFTLVTPSAAQAPLGSRGVIIALHGGGGTGQAMRKVSCPDGDLASPLCLERVANERGFAVVFPNGTGSRPLRNIRTWNAGGGLRLGCTSGAACRSKVDDVEYIDEVLSVLQQSMIIDVSHVYVTGISNGAAMAHRLACQGPGSIKAIASITGGNQFAADSGPCERQVSILHIHGTADPCWAFNGGAESCLENSGDKVSVAESLAGWRQRNGCSAMQTQIDLPDTSDDGLTVTRISSQGCTKPVELLRVNGGGHTWPHGQQYLGQNRVGAISNDISSADIVDFFIGNRE